MADVVQFPRLSALDSLHHAVGFVREAFFFEMSRAEAQANVDARAILINLQNSIILELESEYGVQHG